MQNHWVFIDESKLDRALEEAGRQMRETNQKFAEAMNKIRENWKAEKIIFLYL